MTLLTIKRNVPRPRLAHSLLHPPLSGSSALPLREDTASCLRLPILTAWRRQPFATSVRTSQSQPTSAAFAEPCARFFTRPVSLLLWFAWFPALIWSGLVRVVWYVLSAWCQLRLSNYIAKILNHCLDSPSCIVAESFP